MTKTTRKPIGKQTNEKNSRPIRIVSNCPSLFNDRLRRRLQLRLEDLINLSRRSLFGRVVRLPTLFPFKRQESSDEASSAGKSPRKKANNGRRRRLLGRRKKKEADRQMISIDGKQYYIDDDGALKELNDKNES